MSPGRGWGVEVGQWTQTERQRERETACLSLRIFAVTASTVPLRWLLNIGNTLYVGRFATAVNLLLYLAGKPNVPSKEVHYRIRGPDF